jgi:single-stranded-DNA-specific exonuclease
MEKKWILINKGADFQKIGESMGISPILARLLRNRELLTREERETFLYGGLDRLHRPHLMKGMQEGACCIKRKIKEKKRIRIVGDYDIDGVMSTYILHSALQQLGAQADVKIPHRMKDGYGLNAHIIEECSEDGIDTILTCDNGIAAREEIARAKALGMTVVITDHHEVPFREKDGEKQYLLPEADCIIDPKQEDCAYPFSGICGAVVAYKFVEFLFSLYGLDEKQVQKYLGFAAFATIGDVMELKDENRILVKQGLKALEHTENPGMAALIREQELLGKTLTPYHVGFVLGPCINASGRLDTAALALQLLESSQEEAGPLAAKLRIMNEARKNMTKEAVEAAEKQIEEQNLDANHVLVLYLEDCHESLAGIVAGRIKEKYYKPVIVLTPSEEGIKGSGRSIPAYSMFEELSGCQEFFKKFGGHPMAAGMTLKGEDYSAFSRKLNERETLTQEDLRPRVQLDMELPFRFLSKELVEEIALLEPFGNGNPRPLFACRNVRIQWKKAMGAQGQYARLLLTDPWGCSVEAVLFRQAEPLLETEARELTIAYYPDVNRFRGQEKIQIIIEEYLVIAKK